MGQMKWIYSMVEDGTADFFLDAYKNARINNKIGFTFDYKFIDIFKAKFIADQIITAQKDYDKHIDIQADTQYKGQWLKQ